jgi:uncharacterized membrane protein
MDVLGLTHTVFGLASILFGGLVVARQKGTRGHRTSGRLYFFSMIALNGTALLIYDLFGHFGPFHWLALASLATILAGLVPVVRKRPPGGWLFYHAEFMSWSYVGLLAAAVSEITTRLLLFPFGWTVAVSSVLVFLVGGLIIRKGVPVGIARVRANGARPNKSLERTSGLAARRRSTPGR